MYCAEFETRLNELLDERREPAGDAALVAHAAECPHCAGVLRDFDVLLESVNRLAPPAPRADFTARVVAQALAERPRRVRSSILYRHRLTTALAIAALLLIAAFPAVTFFARLHAPPAVADAGPVAADHTSVSPLAQDDAARQQSLALLRQRLSEFFDRGAASETDDSTTDGTASGTVSSWTGDFNVDVEPLAFTAGRSVVTFFCVMPGNAHPAEAAPVER